MQHAETPIPILSTKLFVPPSRPTLVPRPRLVARLSHGLTVPLTLISAPAGFGKTTLISEWRASNAGRGYPLAYLSIDSEDNDPSRFLTYFVTALGTLKPDLGETALGLLQSPQLPPLQAFLTGLINDLGELHNPFALVVDDYHVITAQPVHEALTFLLDHLPQQMHLVLLTRADPPLPLARLRARNQLVEIRAADLRFTSSEAATFFNDGMGLALSVDDVAGLEQRTEGWIAGLQLAALAIQAPRSIQGTADIAGFVSAFTGSHHYVADYLVAEVLSRQPEPVRSFLLQTSILGRMTGELCDQLLRRSDSQATLRQLETANLFLIPLDEERLWYRYHHLFADVLRTQLRQATSDLLPELHQRAAEWYEQNGFISEAITHALAVGDQQHAARLIEDNALAVLIRGEAVTVLNWIAAIAPLVDERPWLGIHQSWAFICTGQFDRIEPLLQNTEERIDALGSDGEADKMRYHIAGIRALAAVRRGAQEAIDLAQQALQLLPEGDPAVHSVIIYTLGEASWSTGDLAGARRAFIEASRIDKAAGNIHVAVVALSGVADLLAEEGKLHSAADNYRAAAQTATRSDKRVAPFATRAFLGLSHLAYEWNDLVSSARHAEQGLELARRWGNPNEMLRAGLMRARLRQAQGDMLGAVELLHEVEELAQDQGVTPPTAHQVDAFRVRLWLAQSNLEAAANWAGEQTLDPGDEISYWHQVAYLTPGADPDVPEPSGHGADPAGAPPKAGRSPWAAGMRARDPPAPIACV